MGFPCCFFFWGGLNSRAERRPYNCHGSHASPFRRCRHGLDACNTYAYARRRHVISSNRLWYTGGTIHAGMNTTMYWTFHATWRPFSLKSGVMHRTCPSITRTYDSVRSKDAVTFRPRYTSLNQYSFSNINDRCGDLVSRTCFAGTKSVTSHSARNSMILVSNLGRAFWTARNADSVSGTCEAVGMPTVCLAYSSAKKRRHILETHWLQLSMLIVILARGHGSGSVERQCNSSDVSSGATTGSSLSFG